MSKNLIIIDGSNFYHRAKKLAPHVRLTKFNYRKLVELLTGNQENNIEYCVGEIKPQKLDADGRGATLYSGQQALFHNLQQQRVVVKKGFMLKTKAAYHEKGVDVRIATDIVRGALKNEYDTCYVISSDSDILPAIKDAMEAGKTLIYVAFEASMVSKALAINSSSTMFITKSMIENCA